MQQLQTIQGEIKDQLDSENELSEAQSLALQMDLAPAVGANFRANLAQADGALNKAYAGYALSTAEHLKALAVAIQATYENSNKSAADSYSTDQTQSTLQACLAE